MKVYAIKSYGNYGAGMAIVAAESERQARDLALEAENSPWSVNYDRSGTCEEIDVSCAYKIPKIITHFETGE